jgi:peptidylprolyl isomerase
VLLVIPPEKGYGADGNAQAGISGTDTLIFVVDLLLAS